jgi:hypothetical protein
VVMEMDLVAETLDLVNPLAGAVRPRNLYWKRILWSFLLFICDKRVTRWRNWLRHCATSRKVAGWIPDGVTETLQWLNPPGRTMVDSASNRNEYQESFLRAKDGRCVGLTTLPPLCADCIQILGALTSWNPKRPVQGL